MKAMVLEKIGHPLNLQDLPIPEPEAEQVLVKVLTCGVCRTDLHVIEGDLKEAVLPLIPGHEIIGIITKIGHKVKGLIPGQRIGVAWLGHTCGSCYYCCHQQENLCDQSAFTGYQLPGGYAEYTVADYRYCYPFPDNYSDVNAAPLMCAGLIGFRSYKMTKKGHRLGLYGFGAAAHIITQVAIHQDREVYAFTRPGDLAGQNFARSLGACWAGDSEQLPPTELDAAILFAPIGSLIPSALKAIRKGGVVVCAGIHMSPIPSFPYSLLWEERVLRSVANLTRQDGLDFIKLSGEIDIQTAVKSYPLERANQALNDLKKGLFEGAAVLTIARHC
jgi:propanol-preferring alcohol dehydrogenase